MELINNTPYSILTFRTALEDDRFAMAAIVRVTYDVGGVQPKVSNHQLLPLSKVPILTQYGPMESDLVFRRGGVDLFVYGKAIAPHQRPTSQMSVKVTVKNKLRHELMIFGNRKWKQATSGLKIGEPEPFTEMPLSLFNAYGGVANWDGAEIQFPNNPHGKGFYLEMKNAINNQLPNIEDPNNLILNWSDQPSPVGFTQCPLNEIRLRGNMEYNQNMVTRLDARIYNTAFPEMIANEIKAGDEIFLEGFTKEIKSTVVVPSHNLFVKLKLGTKKVERPLVIDQVAVLPDLKKMVINYRYPFRYIFHPLQKRKCEIYETNQLN